MRPLTALFAAGAGLTLYNQKKSSEEKKELRRKLDQRKWDDDDDGKVQMKDPDREIELEQTDAIQRLVDIKERNEPLPESRDATQDGTVTLDPGEAAVIESTPEQGYMLEVQRVYVDRRDEHEYSIEIDGVSVSNIHEWTGTPTRRVTENGKVKLEVTNVSGSATTMDWVIDQQGMPSEVAPGR